MEKKDLEIKLKRLVNESIQELKNIGLEDKIHSYINFSINYRAKKRLGQCHRKTDIDISSWLLEIGSNNDIKNTIIHEILHTFDDTIGHKEKWQYYARYVGNRTNYSITRTANIKEIYKKAHIEMPHRYEITCKRCGDAFHQQKMTTRVIDSYIEGRRIHRKCNGTDFKIVDLKKNKIVYQ